LLDSEHLQEEPTPGVKRGRGRPPGSRNKVGKSAMDLIALHGKGAIETLCRVAAGHAVFSAPDDKGNRERLNPTLAERVAAAKIIADKLVPTLKASEISGAMSNSLTIEKAPPSNIDIAKALLNVFGASAEPPPSKPPLPPAELADVGKFQTARRPRRCSRARPWLHPAKCLPSLPSPRRPIRTGRYSAPWSSRWTRKAG
jgi:hypothetical protein